MNYACTDLHGRYDLYIQIKEFLKPDDKVYFLGDAGDRYEDGWKLIKALLNDQQFVYIKGNHESMLVDAVLEYKKTNKKNGEDYNLLCRNGGTKTFEDWLNDGQSYDVIKQIDNLPLYQFYKNPNGYLVVLSHAGFTPTNDETNQCEIEIPCEFDLLWDRNHIYYGWNNNDYFKNVVVVHGHTPIPTLASRLCDIRPNLLDKPYVYCDNHKICLDCLSAMTGVACLLNIDTFKYQIFHT